MTQTLILEKFQKYLDLTSKKYINELQAKKLGKSTAEINAIDKEIEAHKNFIQSLKDYLDNGHCHGFAVCHGAMDCIGKLEWWENVLVTLANWDGSEEALKKEVNLPGSIETDKDKSLDHLFERALNYVVYHQIYINENDVFALKDASQRNLLQATDIANSKNYFEILAADQQTVSGIKKWANAGGHLTQKDILALLDEKQVQGNICKISNEDHTIRIGFDGKEWMIYDPNYDHRQLNTIHKKGSKEEIVAEVFNRLKSEDLALTIASIKDQVPFEFTYHKQMLQDRIIDLLQGRGLHMLALWNSDAINQNMRFILDKKDPGLFATFVKSLLLKNNENYTGLHMLAFAPEAVRQLFQYTKQSKDPDLLAAIATALATKGNDKWNGLHILARYSCETTYHLFDLAQVSGNAELIAAITECIPEKNKDNWTGLHMLARHAPNAAYWLIQWATQTKKPELIAAIAKTLPEKLNNNKTALHMLATYSKYAVEELYALAENTKDPQLLAAIFKALLEKNDANKSAFKIIAEKNFLPSFVRDLLSNHANMYDNLQAVIKMLATTYEQNQIGWQMLRKYDLIMIRNSIKDSLNKLSSDQLTHLDYQLQDALINPKSEYRGLCYQPYDFSLFNSLCSPYRKTEIWQAISDAANDLLREHSVKLQMEQGGGVGCMLVMPKWLR